MLISGNLTRKLCSIGHSRLWIAYSSAESRIVPEGRSSSEPSWAKPRSICSRAGPTSASSLSPASVGDTLRVDVLEDENPGAFYKGPLALLVNRLSASASEIFAGAMQDYHRALIIGGQTFGKGTVQTIQPLNHGELKLTLAKFYRVSGQSTQHQGVLPDIDYPAVVDTKEIGESALPAAMPWDRISPAIKPASDPFRPFLAELKARHEARTAKDPDFEFTRKSMALSQQLLQQTTVSLNEEKRKTQRHDIEERQLALENARRIAKGEQPLKKLKEDDEQAASAEPDKLPPEKDAYLAESGRILLDYLGLSATVAKH